MTERRLYSVLGNSQRLDGGAMFGNAPRVLWQRWLEPDELGRIPLACRAALVVEADGRKILFEAGIGAFFEPALRERYGVVEAGHVLLESLAARGVGEADVDVVVLSHLHFDHAGGLLGAWAPGREPALSFPNARFLVGREAFERARAPHLRDRASFIPELVPLLERSGRLELVDGEASALLGPGYRFHISHGHTPGLLLSEIATRDGPLLFAADLIPGKAWVHVPITMGYDRFPEALVDEKNALLAELAARRGRLFFTHDPQFALGRVVRDERGRYATADDLADVDGLAL